MKMAAPRSTNVFLPNYQDGTIKHGHPKANAEEDDQEGRGEER